MDGLPQWTSAAHGLQHANRPWCISRPSNPVEAPIMATTNFTAQRANVDEAILLLSFDNLERALREQATDKPAEWAERLARCLMDAEMALGSHQRAVEASDSPTEDQEHHGNVPATIERRWDKL